MGGLHKWFRIRGYPKHWHGRHIGTTVTLDLPNHATQQEVEDALMLELEELAKKWGVEFDRVEFEVERDFI